MDVQDEILKQLMEAQQESFDRLERGSNLKWQGLFIDPLPDGTPDWFKTPAGKYLIDIIPFIVFSDKHFNKGKGKWHYTLEFYQHEKIGPLEKRILCLMKTLGQRCAICDDIEKEKLKQAPNKRVIEAYKYKRRNLYNIWSHMPVEEEVKGVKLWDASYHIFERIIQGRSQIPLEGGSRIWMSPDAVHGKRIYFERKGKGVTDTEYINHDFIDRRMPIPEEIMKQAISLETIIHIPTFEEVYEDWRQVAAEQLGGTTGTTYSYVPQGVNTNPSTQQLPIMTPQQQSFMEQISPEAVKNSEQQCPYGGVFGADCEKTQFCNRCAVWDACAAKAGVVKQEVKVEVKQEEVKQEVKQEAPKESSSGPVLPVARRRRA